MVQRCSRYRVYTGAGDGRARSAVRANDWLLGRKRQLAQAHKATAAPGSQTPRARQSDATACLHSDGWCVVSRGAEGSATCDAPATDSNAGVACGTTQHVGPVHRARSSRSLRGLGHPFYEALDRLLREQGFDRFVEELCEPHYAEVMGRPGLAPGVYFRCLPGSAWSGRRPIIRRSRGHAGACPRSCTSGCLRGCSSSGPSRASCMARHLCQVT